MSYRKIILILFLGIFLSAERKATAQVTTVKFNYTGSLQSWTVPSCVTTVTIDCSGAQGGGVNSDSGGRGARMIGDFNLNSGDVLTLLVGQAGTGTSNGGSAGGGGGGSFVLHGAVPLIIAGGGGGRRDTGPGGNLANTNGYKGTHGQNSNDNSGLGGAAGNGGTSGEPNGGGTGGPGGGLNTNGGLDGSAGGGWGLSYTNLATGGAGCTSGVDIGGAGGYGGGGGGTFCYRGTAGGGGGYSGGGTGLNDAGAGGGGSYNAGKDTVNTTGGASPGNGKIIISYVSNLVNSVQPNVISNIVCNGNATGRASVLVNNLPAGPAFTYSWNPNVSNRDTATGLLAGIYTVTVSGCGTGTTTVTITQPGFFTATPIVNNIACFGGTGSITAGAVGGTGPYTFVFTPGGNVNAINNLAVGTYSLNVLDSRGCATSDLITITQPNPLAVTAYSTDSVACYGQSDGKATSSVTGGTYPYTYLWSPMGGSNPTASGLAAGVYTLNITDNKGCVGSGTVPIYQPAPLTVSLTPALYNLACNGDQNGVLGSGVKGGVGPYTYLWSNNHGVDSNATGLSAGSYSLSVTDAHGCITKQSATVNQPAPLVLSIDSTDNRTNCSGTAWVILNGGVLPYQYMWSNGSTNYYQDNLCNGSYCCTVTDANGCVKNICTNIVSDLGVNTLAANAGKITIYPNPTNGAFTVNVSGVSGSAAIEVYDVLGAKVYSAALDMTKGGNTTVNIANHSNGVYLYRIISNENGTLLGEGKVVLEK